MTIRDELSAEEIGCFRRSGYTVVRGLLTDPELPCLRDAFGSLATTDRLRVDDFAKRLVVTRNLWQHIPGLETIVRRLGPLAGRLMGADEVRLLDDLALVKPPREVGGQPTVWHQDAPNFPFDRRGFLTFWIAVDDISFDQGPLTLLPGSHRLGLLGAVDGGEEETTLATFLTEDDQPYIGEPVTTALAAGDATVHDGSLLHSAGANRTSRARRGWGVRFIPASTLYTGASHQLFDDLNLKPFEPFEHENFPLIQVA